MRPLEALHQDHKLQICYFGQRSKGQLMQSLHIRNPIPDISSLGDIIIKCIGELLGHWIMEQAATQAVSKYFLVCYFGVETGM